MHPPHCVTHSHCSMGPNQRAAGTGVRGLLALEASGVGGVNCWSPTWTLGHPSWVTPLLVQYVSMTLSHGQQRSQGRQSQRPKDRELEQDNHEPVDDCVPRQSSGQNQPRWNDGGSHMRSSDHCGHSTDNRGPQHSTAQPRRNTVQCNSQAPSVRASAAVVLRWLARSSGTRSFSCLTRLSSQRSIGSPTGDSRRQGSWSCTKAN